MRNLNLSLLATIAFAFPVFAYEKSDDYGIVKESGIKAYDAKGVHLGSFTLFPVIIIDNGYDTNILKSDAHELDSHIVHFKPGFSIGSGWSRHALNFSINTDITEFSRDSDANNYEDIFLKLSSRLDILRNSVFDATFSYDNLHEDRGSPDQLGGSTPTFYDKKMLVLNYIHKFNRISVKPNIKFSRFDYENTPTTALTGSLQQSTRSRWEYSPSIRLGYEIQPEYEAFAKLVWKENIYDDLVVNGSSTNNPFNRDSHGFNVLAGMEFDLTEIITGEASIGYLYRGYDDSRLDQISEANGFISLLWRPTSLTTADFNLSRDINETTQLGVSGIITNSIGANVIHELRRNILLKAGVNYSYNQYEGYNRVATTNRKNRVEDNYDGSVSVEYLMNRNFNMSLNYNYSKRHANYALSDYEVHQLIFSLTAQF